MIEEIYIKDLGVIEEARLQFDRGLTVLTGETGAGKTMVLTALGLLLGDRADSSAIRKSQPQAYVEGRWLLSESAVISAALENLGTELSDGELIVNRSINNEGRSKAAIQGRALPVTTLGELSSELVVVHGQSDQIRLKSAAAQRQAIDAAADSEFSAVMNDYQDAYQTWRQSLAAIDELETNLANRDATIADLKYLLEQISEVRPQPGELDELGDRISRLENLSGIRMAASAAHEALSSDISEQDAISLIGLAKKSLDPMIFDPTLEAVSNRLSEANALIREAASDLAKYLNDLEGANENELDVAQSRRAKLNSLLRKFPGSIAELLDREQKAIVQLSQLEQAEDGLSHLRETAQANYRTAANFASRLTELRKNSAAGLVAAVNRELAGLAMPGASLVVKIEPSELGPHGADSVSILLAAYPGAEPRPLGKGASGGELSRIMLAIEVVLAANSTTPTFIFDEVDAGVGGAAAIEIGRRLAKLAKSTQVIVVTHLAQVAAFADRHLRVTKNVGENYTASDVNQLSEVERTTELARMLSGLAESELGLAHAEELLQLANADKANF